MASLPKAPRSGKKALLIGGGAPNSSLMAGALVAFIDRGIEFDVISTSGAGALMGLLYTAPQGGDPRAALSRWADIGVADAIYDWFPVNYKVFMKPGVAADMYRQMLAASPFTRPFFDAFAPGAMNGLWADWVRLFFATMSPTDLTPQSLGLCAHLPFAEQAIDFAKVPGIKPEFYINAYNMTQEQMTIWGKDQITPEHLRAAFSFPFIYPPTRIGSDDYIEGAAIDTINFKALVSDDEDEPGICRDLDTLVVFDILGIDKLIRKPRSLYDAWVDSIITPLVQLSKDDIRLFELQHNIDPKTGKPKRKLLKVDLAGGIPEAHWPKVLDWSSSNLKLLFDVGYQAGIAFCDEHAALLGAKPALRAVA
ncbi:MAG TPA: patatin-like phospholipase family protein [Noviherbaspirillum sp.]